MYLLHFRPCISIKTRFYLTPASPGLGPLNRGRGRGRVCPKMPGFCRGRGRGRGRGPGRTLYIYVYYKSSRKETKIYLVTWGNLGSIGAIEDW